MGENNTNIAIWEDIVKDSPDSYKEYFKAEKKFLLKNIKKNSSILEVGCGEGRSLIDLIKISKNITGLDHEKTAIENATKKFIDWPKINFVLADGIKLPFKNKSFDYVICMLTFVNFYTNKFKILEEMSRVLRDKGKIIISVYSEDALNERLKAYELAKVNIKKILPNGTVIFKDLNKDGFSEQFSKEELEEIFTKTSLMTIKT